MHIGRIRNSNMILRGPDDMDDCGDLHVNVQHHSGMRVMTSAWIPTPDELLRLNQGKAVFLHVYGQSHPPVGLSVALD